MIPMRMEQAEQGNLQHSPVFECSELHNADHHLTTAEEMVDVNCHWSISPALCYAIATLNRLEEERRRCFKNHPADA